MAIEYDKPQAVTVTDWLWGDNREWPPKPARANYAAWREAIARTPLVYRAYQTITEGVRGASPNVIIPSRPDIEDWLMERVENLWSHISSEAAAAVFYGLAIGVARYKRVDGWRVPQPLVFPKPETVEIRVVDGAYAGFRQRDLWGSGQNEIFVGPEKSVLWTYGGPPHNNPYGMGALGVVFDFVDSLKRLRAYSEETAHRHANPILSVTIPQAGASESGAEALAEQVYTRIFEGRIVTHVSRMGEKIEMSAIQPPATAVQDIQTVIDYNDRQVALGLLIALRTMYNTSNEGGSYNLVSVQQEQADQLLSGIIEALRPGFERWAQITLEANGYPGLEMDFDVEKPSELTAKAVRSMMVDLIKEAGMLDRVDFDRLAELSGLPIFLPEGEMNEPTEPDVTRAARKVELPPEAVKARSLLDSHHQAAKTRLERALLEGGIKSASNLGVEALFRAAEDVYGKVMKKPAPKLARELTREWRTYPSRMWGQYRADLKALAETMKAQRLRGVDTTEREKQQRDNLSRKLAAKLAASVYAYFIDLQRAQ